MMLPSGLSIFSAASRPLNFAVDLWSLKNNCNHVGADLCVCPGPVDPPLRGRHTGLPLRWKTLLHLFLKDHKSAPHSSGRRDHACLERRFKNALPDFPFLKKWRVAANGSEV